jgi:hypothetical protein
MSLLQKTAKQGLSRDVWLTRCGIILFCLTVGGMIIAGAPRPTGNDLFWLGPAIGLLKTGQLINPYTQSWIAGFGVKYFYVQGPVYFYFVAAWLHLFGVSTVSITVIHWVFCIVSAACLVLFFWRTGIRAYIGLLAGTLFALWFGREIRPEALACALAFAGLLLWELQDITWRTSLAFFLMGLSILTYPFTLGFIPPFLLLLHLNSGVSLGINVGRRFVSLCFAGVGVTALLALMVHGDIAQFLRVLLAHRNLRASGISDAVPKFWQYITQYKEWVLTAPSFILFAGLAILVITGSISGQRNSKRLRNQMACFASAVLFGILLYPENAIATGEIFAFTCIMSFVDGLTLERFPVLHGIAFLAGVFMIAGMQAPLLLSLIYQRPPTSANIASVRAQLKNTRKRICIDGAVARYIFDYRLPVNAVSLGYGTAGRDCEEKHFAVYIHDASLKNEDDIWAASQAVFTINDGSSAIRGLPPEFYRTQPIRIFGTSLNSIPQDPFKLLVYE